MNMEDATIFNIDQFAPGHQDDPADPMNFLSSTDDIYSLINSRRVMMEKQVDSIDKAHKLHNEIRAMRDSVIGLPEQLAAVKSSAPELYNYILELERFKFWCKKCNSANPANTEIDADALLNWPLVNSV